MSDTEVSSDAAPVLQRAEMRRSSLGPADHEDVVGHRYEQRSTVDVAGPHERIDLEHRTIWMRPIDEPAVIHHVLEDRIGPDDHVRTPGLMNRIVDDD